MINTSEFVENPSDCGFRVGDRVCHVKDQNRPGTIRIIEDNQLSVMVQWDDLDEGELDFLWLNKLVLLDP
jgi:hypothetical protein